MSRKDYILAANIIKSMPGTWLVKQKTINATIELFAKDNPRFDKDRFITACKS